MNEKCPIHGNEHPAYLCPERSTTVSEQDCTCDADTGGDWRSRFCPVHGQPAPNEQQPQCNGKCVIGNSYDPECPRHGYGQPADTQAEAQVGEWRVMQTQFEPRPGPNAGNCDQACWATLLRLPLEAVPNFAEIADDDEREDVKHKWFSSRGLFRLVVEGDDGKLWAQAGLHLAGGKSPRGDWNHICVYRGYELWHDPHPDGTGLESVDWREFAIPLSIAGLTAEVEQLRQERYLPVPCPCCGRLRLLYQPSTHQCHCEKCGADNDLLADQEPVERAEAAEAEVKRLSLIEASLSGTAKEYYTHWQAAEAKVAELRDGLVLAGHRCEPIGRVVKMDTGRDWWVGRLVESIEGWPRETHCLHLKTPLKEMVFGLMAADFDALVVLAYLANGRLTNSHWIESMASIYRAALDAESAQ